MIRIIRNIIDFLKKDQEKMDEMKRRAKQAGAQPGLKIRRKKEKPRK